MQTFALLSALAALAAAAPLASIPTGTLAARHHSGVLPTGTGFPSLEARHFSGVFPSGYPVPTGDHHHGLYEAHHFPSGIPIPTGFAKEARHYSAPSGVVPSSGLPKPTGHHKGHHHHSDEALFALPSGTAFFPTAPSASWYLAKPTGTAI